MTPGTWHFDTRKVGQGTRRHGVSVSCCKFYFYFLSFVWPSKSISLERATTALSGSSKGAKTDLSCCVRLRVTLLEIIFIYKQKLAVQVCLYGSGQLSNLESVFFKLYIHKTWCFTINTRCCTRQLCPGPPTYWNTIRKMCKALSHSDVIVCSPNILTCWQPRVSL